MDRLNRGPARAGDKPRAEMAKLNMVLMRRRLHGLQEKIPLLQEELLNHIESAPQISPNQIDHFNRAGFAIRTRLQKAQHGVEEAKAFIARAVDGIANEVGKVSITEHTGGGAIDKTSEAAREATAKTSRVAQKPQGTMTTVSFVNSSLKPSSAPVRLSHPVALPSFSVKPSSASERPRTPDNQTLAMQSVEHGRSMKAAAPVRLSQVPTEVSAEPATFEKNPPVATLLTSSPPPVKPSTAPEGPHTPEDQRLAIRAVNKGRKIRVYAKPRVRYDLTPCPTAQGRKEHELSYDTVRRVDDRPRSFMLAPSRIQRTNGSGLQKPATQQPELPRAEDPSETIDPESSGWLDFQRNRLHHQVVAGKISAEDLIENWQQHGLSSEEDAIAICEGAVKLFREQEQYEFWNGKEGKVIRVAPEFGPKE